MSARLFRTEPGAYGPGACFIAVLLGVFFDIVVCFGRDAQAAVYGLTIYRTCSGTASVVSFGQVDLCIVRYVTFVQSILTKNEQALFAGIL